MINQSQSDKVLILNTPVPGNEYNIYIGKNLINHAEDFIPDKYLKGKVAIVTDTNVEPLYANLLKSSLTTPDEVEVFTVPAGEQSKSAEQLFWLYDKLLSFGITRTDLIIALGGGVVGDLTGFAAATLLRGIPYIQIPTTLLAQVDSSVGGKTAINLPAGKNLAGAFYQPKAVIADTECLKTLPDKILSDGMAEVIKYGAICDDKLFEKLEKLNCQTVMDCIDEVIHTCCSIKSRIAAEDEKDTGNRMILNFGHTYGHGIEKYYNFEKFTHGMAVAAGMVMACKWGEAKNITAPNVSDRMCKILTAYNLPTKADVPQTAFFNAASNDKKGDGAYINLILIEDIGKVKIHKIPKNEILAEGQIL